ncbi:MAG: DMT family transporter [Pirellulaceae bacterium]|nr:DMT family transporter [Pirellulaceae bacterium]
MSRSSSLPYLWMLCGAASFTVMALLTAGLRERCDWQWVAIARSGLAMLFAIVLALFGGAPLVVFRPASLWARSLAGSISLLCGFYAMTHMQLSEVLSLTNMFPLWVAVLSWPMLGEWPKFDVWPAAFVGVVGMLLIYQVNLEGDKIAMGAALLSAFTSAIALISLHKVREIDPRAIVAHFSGVALLGCVVAMFVFPREKSLVLDLPTTLLLVGVGLFATIGQLFLTLAFSAGPPARVSVVILSQVGFTMLGEMLIWRRTFGWQTLLGIGLVLAPTAWMLLRGGEPVREIPLEEAG